MFRRTFWFTAGAAAGVWATTKVNRKLRSLTPDSLALRAADKAVGTGHRLRDFALDVRAGMAQRESELHEALGLTAESPPVDAPGGTLAGRRRRAALGPTGRSTSITGTTSSTGTTSMASATGRTGKADKAGKAGKDGKSGKRDH